MYELTSHLPAWAPYAGAGTGGAALAAAAVWAGMRRRRPPDPAKAKNRTSRGDLAAAAIATAVSAEGMWETFGAMGMPIPLRIGTFAFIEIMVIQSARRARRSMAEKYSAGIDGIAMWVLTCLSAVLSASHEITSDQPNAAIVMIRLVAPLIAAWGWERNMALERRRRGLPGGIHWRITPERILVRLGLAGQRAAADVDAHRRLTALTRAAKRARRLEDTRAAGWRQRRAMARVDRLYEDADEYAHLSGDTELQQQLLAQVGALFNTRSFVRLDAAPWWASPDTPSEDPPGPPDGKPARSATTVSLLARMRERRTDKLLGIRSVQNRTGETRTEAPRTEPPLTLPSVRPLPVRPAPCGTAWLTPARTDPPRTANDVHVRGAVRIPPVRPVWPLNPVRPAQPRTTHGPRTEEPRKATPHAQPPRTRPARTPSTGQGAEHTRPASGERLPKSHWIEVLAEEIRTAEAEGRTWEPDYADLMARTGYGRSWCEKTSYAARDRAAAQPRTEQPARTGTADT